MRSTVKVLALAAAVSATPMPEMIHIPGGTFTMGWHFKGDHKTQVTLSPYDIDRTEVTVAAYVACIKTGLCGRPDTGDPSEAGIGDKCNWQVPGRENDPINCVDWFQATAYCKAQGKRLPTEAEWEFAAEGPTRQVYPWGNEEPDAQRAQWHSTDGTSPVGSHPGDVSPFGVLDMAGNVSEWVADAFAELPGGTVTNPRHEPKPDNDNPERVWKGGSWQYVVASPLSVTSRGADNPLYQVATLGFRCARNSK